MATDYRNQAAQIALKLKKPLESVSHMDLVNNGLTGEEAMHAVDQLAQAGINASPARPIPTAAQGGRPDQPTSAAQQLSAAIMNGALKSGDITADQLKKNAADSGVNLATTFGNNAVSGVYSPTATAPAVTPAASTTSIQPTAQAPVSRSFSYQPSNNRTDDQRLAAARARAALLIGLQRQEALAGMEREKQAAEQGRQDLLRSQAGAEERNRSTFASRGLGTSGFHAGANAVSQGATQQEIARVNSHEQLAQEALTARLAGLAQQEGAATTANLDQLEQADRAFALQDRAQQFGEFNSNRGYDRGVLESDRNYGIQKAQFDDNYAPGGLGYATRQAALTGANIGNQTAEAQYNDQYSPGGLGYQTRQAQLQGAQLQVKERELQNQMAQLEYTVANDPDLGKRAQAKIALDRAQAELDQTRAQIGLTQAQTTAAGQKSASGGLTPYQQQQTTYNRRQDAIKSYKDDYNISNVAADTWADLSELAQMPKADGSVPTYQELNQVLAAMLKRPGLSAHDQGWLTIMFQAANGNATAQASLDQEPYRKKPIQ